MWETPNVPWSRTRERRKGARGRGVRLVSGLEVLEGEGSGKDWKALSARSPSPVIYILYVS